MGIWRGALILVLLLTLATPAWAGGWEMVEEENGVKVYQKAIEGRDLPIFRGDTVIDANIYDLLAVISDFDRHVEWMHGCHTAKLLKQIDDLRRVSYNRTDAPWPVDDRDVVLESRVEIQAEKHTVLIHFKSIQSPLKPEVEGVVRMNRLKGYYKLTAESATRTRVQYQVDTDPGGSIPDWVVEAVGEDMPINTLTNLRQQVGKVKGQYPAFMKRWDPALNPEAPVVIPQAAP